MFKVEISYIFFNICKALQSLSILKTQPAFNKAQAIDNLPVPVPRSKINLFFMSSNSKPAKYTRSTAHVASILYCSNFIFGSIKVWVFWRIEIKSFLLIFISALLQLIMHKFIYVI
jgi:hypothetical protein